MPPFKGRIIDLSQEIYQGMPVYPGHLKTVVWTHLSHEECQRTLGTGFSCETRGIMFCDHGPTPIDAVSQRLGCKIRIGKVRSTCFPLRQLCAP
jgi:kynurenine formamidase